MKDIPLGPLFGSSELHSLYAYLRRLDGRTLGSCLAPRGAYRVGWKRIAGRQSLHPFRIEPPAWMYDGQRKPAQTIWIACPSAAQRDFVFCALAGRLAHCLWLACGDGFDVQRRDVKSLPLVWDLCAHEDWGAYAGALEARQLAHPTLIRNAGLIGGYDMLACRDITDAIDRRILHCHGAEWAWPYVLLDDAHSHQSVPTRHDGVWPYAWKKTCGPWLP